MDSNIPCSKTGYGWVCDRLQVWAPHEQAKTGVEVCSSDGGEVEVERWDTADLDGSFHFIVCSRPLWAFYPQSCLSLHQSVVGQENHSMVFSSCWDEISRCTCLALLEEAWFALASFGGSWRFVLIWICPHVCRSPKGLDCTGHQSSWKMEVCFNAWISEKMCATRFARILRRSLGKSHNR